MYRIRAFFIKYREGIRNGILAGLLISNFLLLFFQANTSKQVLQVGETIKQQQASDNAERQEARERSSKSDDLISRYMRCIVLLNPPRNPEAVDACLKEARVPVDVRDPAVVPQTSTGSEQNEPRGSAASNGETQNQRPDNNGSSTPPPAAETPETQLLKLDLCVPFVSLCGKIDL